MARAMARLAVTFVLSFWWACNVPTFYCMKNALEQVRKNDYVPSNQTDLRIDHHQLFFFVVYSCLVCQNYGTCSLPTDVLIKVANGRFNGSILF
jgi:hypothetical protein